MDINNKFDLEYQFSLYMRLSELDNQQIPARMVRELKRAFFASAGQLLVLLSKDLMLLEQAKGLERLEAIEEQILLYFSDEKKYDSNFAAELKRRANLN